MPFLEKEEKVAPVQPQKEKRPVKKGRVIRSKKPEDAADRPTSEQEREDEREQEKVKGEDKVHPDADHEPAAAAEPADDADGAIPGAGETDTAEGTSPAGSGDISDDTGDGTDIPPLVSQDGMEEVFRE